jgi:hypothetical protein
MVMPWRKITADQYRLGEDPDDGYDEARIKDPETGWYREVWDVGEKLYRGYVSIETAKRDPILVPLDYPIEVR